MNEPASHAGAAAAGRAGLAFFTVFSLWIIGQPIVEV